MGKMASGIEDIISEFEAKMKQVSPEDMKIAKGETPVEEAVAVAEPVSAGEEVVCIGKGFKQLVAILPSKYVGKNIKDLVVELLESVPECEV